MKLVASDMPGPTLGRVPGELESWLPVSTVILLGGGSTAALAGAGSANLPLTLLGGAAVVAALLLLFSAKWADWVPLLVVILPLPALYTSDQLRLAPAALMTAVVVVAWGLGRAPDRQRLRLGVLPVRTLLAIIVTVALSTAFAQHPVPAIRELLNWTALLALLIALVDHLSVNPADRGRRLALWVAAVMAVSGLVALTQSVGLVPAIFPLAGTRMMRATLGFGWPNELGTFFAVGIPFSVYAVQVTRRPGARVIAVLGLCAAVLGLLGTFSRGSWLAMIGATPVLFLFGQGRTAAWTWLTLMVLIACMDLATGGALSARVLGTVRDPYVLQRMALTLTGLLIFWAHPVLGVGPGGYAEALEEFGPQVIWLWDYVGSSHNAFVEIAAETGALGLMAFLAFFGVSFRRLLDSARAPHPDRDVVLLRRTVLWAFATICLVSFTIWPLAHGIGQLVMVVLAIGFASSDV